MFLGTAPAAMESLFRLTVLNPLRPIEISSRNDQKSLRKSGETQFRKFQDFLSCGDGMG
jgi:hypothetical protein